MLEGLAALELGDIDDRDADPAKKKKKKKKKKAPEEAAKPAPEPMPAAKPVREDMRASDSLELDFEAAGIVPKKQQGVGPSRPQSGTPAPELARPVNLPGSGIRPRPDDSDDTEGYLLGRDSSVAIPLGLGIGLLLSMLVAIQLQRNAVQERVMPLEEELLTSVTDPAAVRSGEVRDTSRIDAELEDTYGALHRKFVLVWLLVGVPLGLVLSRIPRPTR